MLISKLVATDGEVVTGIDVVVREKEGVEDITISSLVGTMLGLEAKVNSMVSMGGEVGVGSSVSTDIPDVSKISEDNMGMRKSEEKSVEVDDGEKKADVNVSNEGEEENGSKEGDSISDGGTTKKVGDKEEETGERKVDVKSRRRSVSESKKELAGKGVNIAVGFSVSEISTDAKLVREGDGEGKSADGGGGGGSGGGGITETDGVGDGITNCDGVGEGDEGDDEGDEKGVVVTPIVKSVKRDVLLVEVSTGKNMSVVSISKLLVTIAIISLVVGKLMSLTGSLSGVMRGLTLLETRVSDGESSGVMLGSIAVSMVVDISANVNISDVVETRASD